MIKYARFWNSEKGTQTHTCTNFPVSCHVMSCTTLGLCQQRAAPWPWISRTVSQNKPLFFQTYPVWGIMLFATGKQTKTVGVLHSFLCAYVGEDQFLYKSDYTLFYNVPPLKIPFLCLQTCKPYGLVETFSAFRPISLPLRKGKSSARCWTKTDQYMAIVLLLSFLFHY